VKDVLKNFDMIASAPGGIPRLRKLILDLAVRGKLVPQDPKDEPASKLLEKIAKEKARLITEGKIKSGKPLPPISEEEKPFKLPKGWEWVRVYEICIINPRNDLDANLVVSFIPMSQVPGAIFQPHGSEKRSWVDIKTGFTHFAEGDVSIAKITPCFENGKGCVFTGLENGYGAGTTELHIVRPIKKLVSAAFLHVYFKSPSFMDDGISKMTGTAGQKRLPREYLESAVLYLPPLAEQERIVTRVKELMSRLDEMEAASEKLDRVREHVADSLTKSLSVVNDARELRRSWNRIDDHFDLLIDRPSSVKTLRSAILDLAVRGKLVPQDPKDEPASKLLEKTAKEKARLITEGKIKTGKPLPPITEEEKPFKLPKGWEWVRFGDLGSLESGGTPSSNNPQFWEHGSITWICPKDMKSDYIERSIDVITKKAVEESNLSILPKNTFLIVVRGMILAKKVPVALSRIPLTINQDMKAMIAFQDESLDYLLQCMNGLNSHLMDLVEHSSHGTCKLETPKLMNFIIPLPPLSEQERIVAKVKQLMAVCDRLEAGLAGAEETARAFADAVVRQAV